MNYYEILEVKKDATQQEIRDSYKNLMKKYHPDIYSGNKDYAEKITSEINAAYDVLCDEEKRAEYDLSLEEPAPQPTVTYEAPNIHYRDSYYTNYYNNYTSSTNDKTNEKTWDQKFKENLYNYVDKRSASLSTRGKYILIIIIILIALLLTLISLNDYMTFLSMPSQEEEIPENEYYEEYFDIDEYYQNNYTKDLPPYMPNEQM